MPKYDSTNKCHAALSRLAKKVTKSGVNEEIYSMLDENYINLCKEI